MSAAIIFGLLIALMLTGMPISIALGLTVLTFLFTMTDVPIEAVGLKLFTGIENFEIMAIPFFILAGNFLTHGGVARRMIRFATSLIGHWYGGLGLAGVMACALFAAISGSSPATVIAIGSIVMPAMIDQGFPKRFGAGVITTSGALGILIPPSIVMVIYSVATSGATVIGPDGHRVGSASVGQLFMAGVIPGLMLATMLGATTWYRAWRNDYPRMPRATWGERFTAFRQSVWGLLLILLVLGGIYSGMFTPTEAAAVSAVYAFFIAVFIYRDLTLADVPRVLLASANMSAMILYIITNAVLFSFLMTSEQIPQALTSWIAQSGLGWIGFLLVVNVLLLVAGNVMEASSIILITAPILFPIAARLGINPVHLGIVMTVNMEVGMCHPPVGLNLYVASGIARMGITELTVAVWPWLMAMLIFLVIVTYTPAISLWLPGVLGML
ncbi:MAG: C4-dicarboxylate transporter, DctM subunit [Methylobacteriaceae bacterium]|nr:C4-dicarboxylate transporter, DctM subunit [Methylobacteriaceae bacterium]